MIERLLQRLNPLLARLDALPHRDRVTLLVGLVALAVGLQMVWLLPMRDARLAVAQATADEVRQRDDQNTAATEERTREIAELRQREQAIQAQLAGVGLADKPREPLSAFIARTMQSHGATLVSLDARPSEALETPAAVVEDTGVAMPEGLPAPQPAAPLFRHRATVFFEGPLPAVLAAIEHLERGLAPMRIETLEVLPGAGTGRAGVKADLTTLSQERTWLAL